MSEWNISKMRVMPSKLFLSQRQQGQWLELGLRRQILLQVRLYHLLRICDVSLADEWIRKLQHIYTMDYHSAIKRNAFESVLMRWINLQPITQREVSQKEKDNYCLLMHINGIQKIVLMILHAGQQRRHRKNRLLDSVGGKGRMI